MQRQKQYIKQHIIHKIVVIVFFLFAVVFVNNSVVKADGFVQKKGEGLFISTIAFQQFNGIDTTGAYDESKKVMQMQFNEYFEYGLTKRITIGSKLIMTDSFLNSKNSWLKKAEHHTFGLDSFSLFTRIRIFQTKHFILSFYQGFQTPSWFKQGNPASYFGIRKWQYDSKLEIGINLNKKSFFTLSFGYHGNIKHWYDELRLDLTYGYYFMPKLLMLVKFQKYIYYVKDDTLKNTFIYATDFSFADLFEKSGFAKFTLSFVSPISEKLSLEVGFYTTIKSKFLKTQNLNLDMQGVYFSLWWFIGKNKH